MWVCPGDHVIERNSGGTTTYVPEHHVRTAVLDAIATTAGLRIFEVQEKDRCAIRAHHCANAEAHQCESAQHIQLASTHHAPLQIIHPKRDHHSRGWLANTPHSSARWQTNANSGEASHEVPEGLRRIPLRRSPDSAHTLTLFMRGIH